MSENSYNLFLEQSLNNTQCVLTQFASSQDFLSDIETSFDNDSNRSILESLRQEWLNGNSDSFPEIEIVSSQQINGANGAFASQTNKIYLARQG